MPPPVQIKLCRDFDIIHQDFSIQWRNLNSFNSTVDDRSHSDNSPEDNDDISTNDNSADVDLICSDGRVRLHQFVLSAASPMIRNILVNPLVHLGDVITLFLPDFSKQQVLTLVPFLYGMSSEGAEFASEQPWQRELLKCLQIGGLTEVCCEEESVSFQIPIKEEQDSDVPNEKRKGLKRSRKIFEGEESTDDDSTQDEIIEVNSEEDVEGILPLEDQKRYPNQRYIQLKNKQWRCILCKKTCKSKDMFRGHFQKDHPEFADVFSVEKLQKSKTVDVTKQTIEEVTQQNQALDILEQQAKPKISSSEWVDKEGGWECTNCQLFVSHRFKQKNHLCWYSHDLDDVINTALFECGGCAEAFDQRTFLLEHLRATDCKESSTFPCEKCNAVIYDRDSNIFHGMLRHSDSFQCEYCDKIFTAAGSYLKHWKTKHRLEKREHKCQVCFKVFNLKKTLTTHLLTHNIRLKHACKFCDKVFTCKSSLSHHKKQHTDPSALQCKKCPRSFSSVRGLTYHMNIHNGVFNFSCEECDSRFITRQKLKNHQRSKHTFEKPYLCDQCPKRFGGSQMLLEHRRKAHTGERPYKCGMCNWRGFDSSSLCHHRRVHHKSGVKKSDQGKDTRATEAATEVQMMDVGVSGDD